MAKNPKPIFRKHNVGYIPQMNDDNIGHLPSKRQKHIVLKAQKKRG
jgi:hypothetical protein